MIPIEGNIDTKISFVSGGVFDFKISKVILVNDYLIKNKENKQEIIEYILNFKGENYDKISKEIWDIIFIDSRENFQFDIWENGRKKLGSNKGNSIDNGNGRRNTEEIRENKSDSVYGRGKRGKNETRFSKSKIDSNGNKLTNEQIEYLEDSVVRDDNGNLIPLYHGTTWEFYTFDKNKANVEGDMGKGFYFTNQEYEDFLPGIVIEDLANIIERDFYESIESGKKRTLVQIYRNVMRERGLETDYKVRSVFSNQTSETNGGNIGKQSANNRERISERIGKTGRTIYDFRRLQEESGKMSNEELQRYKSGSRKISDELYGRLTKIYRGRLETFRGSNSNSSRLLKLNDYNIIENVDVNLFHDIFEINRHYLENGELVDGHVVKSADIFNFKMNRILNKQQLMKH